MADPVRTHERLRTTQISVLEDHVHGTGGYSNINYTPAGTGAVTTTVQTKLLESVSVLDFMTPGQIIGCIDGSVDVTAAITSAINAIKGTISTGSKSLFFPRGIYLVISQINITDLYGLTMYGEGSKASIIKYNATNDAIFYITTYSGNTFKELGFTSTVGKATHNNMAFKFNGTGGGTECTFINCDFVQFHTAIHTKSASVNDDVFTFNTCHFRYNSHVWDNSNSQAVLWAFTDCQVLYTESVVFKNPAGQLSVTGGSYINQGTFCSLDDILAGVTGLSFKNVKFETTQNFTPPGAPVWFRNTGSVSFKAIFEGCSDVGGGAYTGNTFDVRGLFELTLKECDFQGKMLIYSNASLGAVPSTLRLIDNINTPEIIETLLSGQGYTPATKIVRDSKVKSATTSSDLSGTLNRRATATNTSFNTVPFLQRISWKSKTVGAVTTGAGIDLTLPAGTSVYGLLLADINLFYNDSSTATAAIDLYTDSGKGTKIYTYAKPASTGNKFDRVGTGGAGMLINHIAKYGDSQLYLEIVPAGDLGVINLSITLTFMDIY